MNLSMVFLMLLLAFPILVVTLLVLLVNHNKPDAPRQTRNYESLYQQPGLPSTNTEPEGREDTAPKAVSFNSSDMASLPPIPAPAYLPPPVPKAPKKPFSPIPLLLIAGVCFLFLGGIIFLTSTWNALPDGARAVTLLSLSLLFFGVNILAERVMKLPKTGLAFYILGCIFLPLTVSGIAVFRLMGDWLSFSGDGRFLMCGIICLCISLPSLVGHINYKSTFLAWLGLMGISGLWMFLSLFIEQYTPIPMVMLTTCVLLTVFAAASSIGMELYCRAHSGTGRSKAIRFAEYAQNFLYSLFFFALGSEPGGALPACILAAVMAVLFLSRQYISGNTQIGFLGFTMNLLISLAHLSSMLPDSGDNALLFVIMGAAILLLAFEESKFIHSVTASTLRTVGLIFAILAEITALIIGNVNDQFSHPATAWLFLVIPGILALIRFSSIPKHRCTTDTPVFCLYALMLFTVCSLSMQNSVHLILLPILAATLLLIRFFIKGRLWSLVLAICSCAGILLTHLPHTEVTVSYLAAAALLGGAAYASRARRPILESACGLAGIPVLLYAACLTFYGFLENTPAQVLTLTLLVLIYCLFFGVFWKLSCAETIQKFSENLALFLSIIVGICIAIDQPFFGWYILAALVSLFFAGVGFKCSINAAALPQLLISFFLFHGSISQLSLPMAYFYNKPLLQALCYLAILLVYAGMGRLLQPEGLLVQENGHLRIDWALIAGICPVFCIASVIDWYPSILTCLFLSIYSLMYLGRTNRRYIPTFFCSMFGCLSIFFHNCHDPFGILGWLDAVNMKSPRVLLLLLPMHLFILSLLWILPNRMRKVIHTARFCMYCVTMAVLLAASMSFGLAEDAIILAVFSLAILLGSFAVKRLRWFTLGFSVLFLMTLRMTWNFWRSLHWGIYLFLVGALLIGIAFYYEYAVRRNPRKPDSPVLPEDPEISSPDNATSDPAEQQKVHLFKEWTW